MPTCRTARLSSLRTATCCVPRLALSLRPGSCILRLDEATPIRCNDRLPNDDDPRHFRAYLAEATAPAAATGVEARVEYAGAGIYLVALMPSATGRHSISVTLDGVHFGGGTKIITVQCPLGFVELSDGTCGCDAGQYLDGGLCKK